MYWSDGSLFPYIKAMMGLLVRTPAEQRDPARVEELKQSLNRLIAMLNDDLAQRDYIAGDTFSIADMALAPLLYPWREVCHDRPDFPHIERWFALIETRPRTAISWHCRSVNTYSVIGIRPGSGY